METEGITKPGTDSQDSDELAPQRSSNQHINKATINIPIPQTSDPSSPATNVLLKLKPSIKGVENAKKRLRAFSIQKKTPITPISVNKAVVGSKSSTPVPGNTVFIGKLSGVKVTPKSDDVEQKKLLKPPKPGQNKKSISDSYTELQKRTLSEIEDMKRKMELVELGIPLGLICPTANSEKAMPTKAMPPIKSFLDPSKLDEIIREAKKAKAQGKEFKFDYQKLLPDYDNPFQRKKEEADDAKRSEPEREYYKKPDRDNRKNDRYDRDSRRFSFHRKDDRDRRKDDKDKHKRRSRDKETKKEIKTDVKKPDEKETDVNLSDYLVCDSWSLENEDKTNSSSPKRQENTHNNQVPQLEDQKAAVPTVSKEIPAEPAEVKKEKEIAVDSPNPTPKKKIERLQPVVDSFKLEIDPEEDEILNMFDENSDIEVYSKVTRKREEYDSPFTKMFDFESSKDASNDVLTEDTFLESVINEIKQEAMSDDEGTQDKGLVEYDSPSGDSPSPKETRSITPELDDRMREVQSSRSDYSSDGYRSMESGYKSTESGYKSNASYKSDNTNDSYRMSMEKEVVKMPKATVDSLETWSFVLKICQPLLFRHDRNKCYRETRSTPKIWFTENPKLCSCVKDRTIVYEELETCKMNLVDRVYGCDQIQESEFPKTRGWYPRFAQCLTESSTVTAVAPSTEWEADDSQLETLPVKQKANTYKTNRSTTPIKNEEIYLDREYQRFMEAVWPEVSDAKSGTPRSTTPVKQDARKKKAEDPQPEDKKRAKKIKLSSEGWSQESDIEEDLEKNKKMSKDQKVDKVKLRKRRRSSSLTDSDNNSKRKRKASKKKANKKTKSKLTKSRRLSKKYLKKLKDKQKKKKKSVSDDEEIEKEIRKKEKKLKKKKLLKKKNALKKKKSKAKLSSSSSSTSTSSSSETSSYSESEDERKKKRKKSDAKNKKRKQSTSDSTQSEDLFDVNVLNNIKTERLTDDEKKLEFSPRRQKPREIINVKELQNDFVGSVQIKKEVEDTVVEKQKLQELELVVQKEEKEFITESVIESNSEISPIANNVCDSVNRNEAESGTDIASQSAKETISHSLTETNNKSAKKISAIEIINQSDKDTIPHSVTESISQNVDNSISQNVTDSISQNVAENISEEVPDITDIMPQTSLENIPIPKDNFHSIQFKEPMSPAIYAPRPISQDRPEVSQPEELSQCSSQESTTSKDPYEKDDSHLRPSSQNSNYSFNDVISASQNYQKDEEDKFEQEGYEEGNYEMYEQLAMAYQSDVAKQGAFQPGEWWGGTSQRIETVVRMRARGEIKCDWRASPAAPQPPAATRQQRPSRWGLKPGEVNIVLTGGNSEVYPIQNVVEPVYQIQTLANNRAENNSTGSYDEAYEDMYGAADRLQYGDCFATDAPEADLPPPPGEPKKLVTTSSLDDRINKALQATALEEAVKVKEESDADKEAREKGILSVKTESSRSTKRVSFADGYKPGQDSDVEEPPKKRKKARRLGCAWPCPATHPDHVPLWDALPPPPPPPGSPPPPFLRQHPNMLPQQMILQQPPPMMQQQPPPMMQSQPPPLMQQPPSMIPQQPPSMIPQQPPQMMQQPPQMMQQQPPPMIQQQIMQQQQLLQQQGINPAMLQAPPFAMGQKMDPSVSLPNFMPPEPPPGLISF